MEKHDPYFDNLFYHEKLKKQSTFLNVKIGDKIHLHTIQGTYTVTDIKPNMVKITCKSWINRTPSELWVYTNNVKCKYGGGNVKK